MWWDLGSCRLCLAKKLKAISKLRSMILLWLIGCHNVRCNTKNTVYFWAILNSIDSLLLCLPLFIGVYIIPVVATGPDELGQFIWIVYQIDKLILCTRKKERKIERERARWSGITLPKCTHTIYYLTACHPGCWKFAAFVLSSHICHLKIRNTI